MPSYFPKQSGILQSSAFTTGMASTASPSTTGPIALPGAPTHSPAPSGTATPSPTPTTTPTSTPSPTPSPSPTSVVYAAPIQITSPGTYTGNYQSTDANVPAIEVYTSGAVILQDCNVKGPGPLIRVWPETNLTVKNCNGIGEGDSPGKFIESANLKSLVMENNYMEGVSKGVLVYQFHGTGGTSESIRVVGNIARNIKSASDRASFLQFNQVVGVSNIEIAYNQVINQPGLSQVEDNINFYNSSGTASSPISVHDNYVQGAYPRSFGTAFTGTGMTTDGDGTLALMTGNIEAQNNSFISTCNAAMNLAGGYNIRYHDNRMISSSQKPDRSGEIPTGCTWGATGAWNNFNLAAGSPYYANNSIDHNVIGFVSRGITIPYADRQDVWSGCSTSICHDNTSLPNPVTLATEKTEWATWDQKLVSAGKQVGSSRNSNSGTAAVGNGGTPYP